MRNTITNRLPTFIIGGAPRCGTSFLCHMLDKHPDVFIAKPFVPEPKVCLKLCDEGYKGYRKQYALLFANAPNNKKALGEKSSAYFENKDAFERLCQIFNNTMRFIFIVREPVQRAFSNYLRSFEQGIETLSFKEAIQLESQRQDPFPPERSYVRPFDYLSRGDYATYAERYLSAFGAHNIKFILFETIQHSPDQFYQEIQTFIGVDPLPRALLETGPVNMSDKKIATLDQDLADELRKVMRPKVERFASLTHLDIGLWGY